MADQAPVTVGQKLKFKAYLDLQGAAPILKVGEELTVDGYADDGGFTVVTGDGRKETLFMEEVEPPATEAAKAAPRTRGKAKGAETAPAAAPAAPAAAAAPKAAGKGKGAKAAAAEAPALPTPAKAKGGKAKGGNAVAAAAAAPAPAAGAAPARGRQKAAAAAPEAAPAPEPVVIVNTDAVNEIIASNNNDMLAAVEAVKEQIDQNFYTLGGLLAHVYHEESYKSLGGAYAEKGGWNLYLEEVVGIGYRRGMDFISIYTTYTALEHDEAALAEVGWTKARALVGAITPENSEKLIEFAKSHSKVEVDNYVKETFPDARTRRGKGEGEGSAAKGAKGDAAPKETTRKVDFKFAAYDNEALVVEQAIELAKSRGETTDTGTALKLIVGEWAQLSGAEVSLDDAMAALEAKYDVILGFVEGGGPDATPEEKAAARAAQAG